MEIAALVSLVSHATPLGIPGFTFSDLHEPERLSSLEEAAHDE
jgi:hypothetical protein